MQKIKRVLKNLEETQSACDEFREYFVNCHGKWNPSDPWKCIKAYKKLEKSEINFLKTIKSK